MHAFEPAQPAQPSPLGPDSLTWRYFGDLRGLLLIGRTGILQNMRAWRPALTCSPTPGTVCCAPSRPSWAWSTTAPGGRHRLAGACLPSRYQGAGRAGAPLRPQPRAVLLGPRHLLRGADRCAAMARYAPGRRAMRAPLPGIRPLVCTLWIADGAVPASYAAFRVYWQQMLEQRLQATEITIWYFGPTARLPAPIPGCAARCGGACNLRWAACAGWRGAPCRPCCGSGWGCGGRRGTSAGCACSPVSCGWSGVCCLGSGAISPGAEGDTACADGRQRAPGPPGLRGLA